MNRRVFRKSDSVSTTDRENSPPKPKDGNAQTLPFRNNTLTPVEVSCDISTPSSSSVSCCISSKEYFHIHAHTHSIALTLIFLMLFLSYLKFCFYLHFFAIGFSFLLDFETSGMSYLSAINENIDQHSIILNELLRSVRKTNDFPLNSLETFQNFDSKLISGAPFTKYMVR